MELGITSILVIAAICALVGFFGGMICHRCSLKKVGTLIIDKENPEVNGGVYTVFDDSPFDLKDKQLIVLDVLIADVASQQEQGT